MVKLKHPMVKTIDFADKDAPNIKKYSSDKCESGIRWFFIHNPETQAEFMQTSTFSISKGVEILLEESDSFIVDPSPMQKRIS